jgi:arginine decarboxylase
MQVVVTTGTGTGPTILAAFDAALLDAGIANYNLMYLSSVIPAGASIKQGRFAAAIDEYGYRLYVVVARHDEHESGKSAWAGLGWTQE